MGFATDAIHAGQEPDSATGAVTVPIYQTSTYAQEGLGKNKGYEYARTSNPTRLALERNLAALEGAQFGYCFASGMSAIDATLRLVKGRSEEHTSELQSHLNLVCRLLLEKKKKEHRNIYTVAL